MAAMVIANMGKFLLRSASKTALLCLLCVLACGGEKEPPNVILIGVDTLRPDHLSCYGYGRRTSPNIDRLAADGVLFEKVVSQCPWTLPSFASVFTSLYPTQHGAGAVRSKMKSSFPTLASILADAGYTTGAIISAGPLSAENGVARGFRDYDCDPKTWPRVAPEVTDLALRWIDDNRTAPFFLFLHFWDPHEPYIPPQPYDTLFYSGRGNETGEALAHRFLEGERFREGSFPEEDLKRIIALYDGEIAYTDKAIGDLLSGLADRGIAGNTMIVLHGDHGEEFLEHGRFGHGATVFNEVLMVPLVFSYRRALRVGARIDRQVRLIDIMPTILDVLGIAGEYGFEGVSLAPLLTGDGDVVANEGALFPPGVAYSEAVRVAGEAKSVSAYPLKLIYYLLSREHMAFNLRDDPTETTNLFPDEAQETEPLEALLHRAIYEMSDVWYLEMNPGSTAREFGIRVCVADDSVGAWITGFRPLGGEASIVDADGYVNGTGGLPGPVAETKDLRITRPVTLNFRAHAPRARPLLFSFKIDGEPAVGKTFIGETLKEVSKMPFKRIARRARVESVTGPQRRPEPPYVLVWHVEGEYGGEIPAELGEDVKTKLRALGYIQ